MPATRYCLKCHSAVQDASDCCPKCHVPACAWPEPAFALHVVAKYDEAKGWLWLCRGQEDRRLRWLESEATVELFVSFRIADATCNAMGGGLVMGLGKAQQIWMRERVGAQAEADPLAVALELIEKGFEVPCTAGSVDDGYDFCAWCYQMKFEGELLHSSDCKAALFLRRQGREVKIAEG